METVAITYDKNEKALIVPLFVARALYDKYEKLTLTHEEDRNLFRALTIALDIQPPPMLAYGTGEETLAARTIREWKERQSGS